MRGLDLLLSKPSHLAVLRVLHQADGPISGREVQRRTGLSNRAAMLALEGLVGLSAVRREETSRAHRYAVNPGHYLVARAMRAAFEAEELFWDDLRKVVRRVVLPRPVSAVVTGPLARDETLPAGRLEITMVFGTGRHRMRAYRSQDDLVEAIWDRYAMNIEPNWMDVNTVNNPEYEPVWRRVEREGVLLFGTLP